MVSCHIETDRLILGMDSLREAFVGSGQDASTLVQDETKRLARTIVAFVPPIAKGRSAKQVGEDAVDRDLKNLISEASPNLIDEVGSKYGVHDINQAYVTEATGARLNLQWSNLDPTGARLREYHEHYRNRDGRIPKVKPPQGVWMARVVVPLGSREPFIDTVKAHVGHFKATWAKVGAVFGDRYPKWISRHFGSSLGIVNKSGLANLQAPSVVFGSKAAGNRKIARDVQQAVNARAKIIARRVKLILSGYNKDLAQGMRAQARAKHHSEPMPAIE